MKLLKILSAKVLAAKIFVTIFLLLFSNYFYGFVVVDLYNISIPIEQNGRKLDNDILLKIGLNQLLVKLSGSSNFEENEVIKLALQNPKKYLQEYSLSKSSDNNVELKQGYNKLSIDTLMREAKLPTWGASRPLAMLWVVVEQELGERALVSDSEETNEFLNLIQQNINKASNIRALPIAWPLYDLDERQSLSIKNLWNLDREEVQSLSAKYRPDEIVMGKIYLEGDTWHIKWAYKDNVYSFESNKDDLSNELITSFNEITNRIAEEYSFIPNNESQKIVSDNILPLKVDNINNLNKLTALMDYLKNIKSIASSSITQIDGINVVLELDLKAPKDIFLKEIKLENKLVIQDQASKILSYRWNS